MKGETIHFKIAHGGVTRRFALPRDSVDLIAELKKRVKKIVDTDDFELYWRDENSQIVLEDGEDMFAAVDYAETKNKLGCVSLEVGDMRVKEEEENRPKAVTMEESKLSFNGFAFMCDGCHCYLASSNGGRFKCTICDNYDLCAACVTKTVHDNHAFILLRNAETEIPLVNENGAVLSMMVKDAERCTPTFVVKIGKANIEVKLEKEETDNKKSEALQQKPIVNIWSDSEEDEEKFIDYLNRQKLTLNNGKLTNNLQSEKEDAKNLTGANVSESVTVDKSSAPMKENAEIKEATKMEDSMQKYMGNELVKTDEKKVEIPVEQEDKKEMEYSREEMMEIKKDTESAPVSSSIPAELHPSFPKKESMKKALNAQSIFKKVVDRDGEKKEEDKMRDRREDREGDLRRENDWRNGRENRRDERSYREYDRGENRHDDQWNYRRNEDRRRYDEPGYWGDYGYDDRRDDQGFDSRRNYRDDDYDYRNLRMTIQNDRYNEREEISREERSREREYDGGRDVRYKGGRRDEDRGRRYDEEERRDDQRERRDESNDRRREDTNEERDPCCEWHQILQKGIIFGPGHENRELEEFLDRREAASRDRNAPGRREERRYIREAIGEEEERIRMEELDRLRREEEKEEADEDGYQRDPSRDEDRGYGRRDEANRSDGSYRPPRDQSQSVGWRAINERERDNARGETNGDREDGKREENTRSHGNEGRNGWEDREERRRNRREERYGRYEDSDSDSDNGWKTPSEDSEQMARQRGERGRDREYSGIPSGYDSNHPDPRRVHPYHRKDEKMKRLEEKKRRTKEIEEDYSMASQIPAHLAIAVITDRDMRKMDVSKMICRMDEYIKHVQNNTYSLKPHIRIFQDGDDVELIGNIAIDLAKHLRTIRSIILNTPRSEFDHSDCLKALDDHALQLIDALRKNGTDGTKYREISAELHPILLTGKFTSFDGQPYGNWDDEFVGFMVADPLRDFAPPPRVPSADPSREGLFAPIPKGCRGAKKTAPPVPDSMPAETNEKLLAELEDTDLFDDYQRMYRVCAIASDLREAIDMMLEGDKEYPTH